VKADDEILVENGPGTIHVRSHDLSMCR